MAKIISSRKKYVPVKDLKVYPSNKETIEVIPDDGFNGAHRYEGSVAPVKYDDKWNTSDEETDDSTWIGEFDLRATYGVGFVESLPDIANGEMTEIRIKYTAEKCE